MTTATTAADLIALGPKGFLPVITRADREQAWGVNQIEGHLGYHDAHVREYLAQDDDSVRDMLWNAAVWPLIEAEEAQAERDFIRAEGEALLAEINAEYAADAARDAADAAADL